MTDDRRTTMAIPALSVGAGAPPTPSEGPSKGATSNAPHSPDPWAEATARADRTREAIPWPHECREHRYCQWCRALARIDSDLASLRDALDGLADCDRLDIEHWRVHAARYARQRDRALTELDRTATAYGVTRQVVCAECGPLPQGEVLYDLDGGRWHAFVTRPADHLSPSEAEPCGPVTAAAYGEGT